MQKLSRKHKQSLAGWLNRGSSRKTTAQAMVEFALALPVLLLVVYGLIESGRLLTIYASVVSSARQAVRYGSVAGNNGSGTPYYNDCAGIRAAAKRLGFLQRFDDANILISYDDGPGGAVLSSTCPLTAPGHPVNGDRVRVQVSANYSPIVPLVPFRGFTISSTGNRTLLIGVPIGVDVPPVILTPGAHGAITILKDASPAFYDTLGQTITYTYSLKNQGSDPATDIIVHDNKVASNNCSSISSIAAGQTRTCTGTYSITQADIDNGSLTNVASFVATETGQQYSAFTSLTINFAAHPSLALAKVGTPPAQIPVGALIQYVFTLTNNGNVPLTSPYSITDAVLDTAADCSAAISPLPVGQSTTCTGHHALTAKPDLSTGIVTNTATARATYRTQTIVSNTATATTYVPPLLLEVSTAPTNADHAGQVIAYTYTLTNRTPNNMSSIVVTDTYPSGHPTCPSTLAANATTTCTVRNYTVTQADMDAGFLSDTVSATAVASGKAVQSNQVIVTVTINQNRALQLIKTAAQSWPAGTNAPAPPGPSITYTYTLKNTGGVTLSSPYTVTDNKVTVNCTGATGSLAPNATIACAPVTYPLVQGDLDAGSVINQATATAKFGAQTVISAPTSATVITYTQARLGLVKTPNPSYWQNTGQQINYTFTLKNTGGKPLTSPFGITDNKLDTVSCAAAVSPIPVGGSTTCTGRYTVRSSDPSNASIKNHATATAYDGATQISASADAEVARFQCTGNLLKHTGLGQYLGGLDIVWTVVNNTGIPLHISAILVMWNAFPPTLTQVFLAGAPLPNSVSSSYGGFYVPGGPWNLPTGNTNMEFIFSPGAASSVRIILAFNETDCGTVDSYATYPD